MSVRSLSIRRGGVGRSSRAVILLEVILGLGLFTVGGAVALGALSASLGAVKTVRREARAADLTITTLSLLQLEELDPVDQGPNEFEDETLEGWTWEITAVEVEDDPLSERPPLTRVEIIITYVPDAAVYRLVRLLPAERGGVRL